MTLGEFKELLGDDNDLEVVVVNDFVRDYAYIISDVEISRANRKLTILIKG